MLSFNSCAGSNKPGSQPPHPPPQQIFLHTSLLAQSNNNFHQAMLIIFVSLQSCNVFYASKNVCVLLALNFHALYVAF